MKHDVHIASWRDEEGSQGGGPWYNEIPLRLGQLIIWNETSVPPLDMHEWTSYYFWEFYCYGPEAHCYIPTPLRSHVKNTNGLFDSKIQTTHECGKCIIYVTLECYLESYVIGKPHEFISKRVWHHNFKIEDFCKRSKQKRISRNKSANWA
jgi:hypothetical protein